MIEIKHCSNKHVDGMLFSSCYQLATPEINTRISKQDAKPCGELLFPDAYYLNAGIMTSNQPLLRKTPMFCTHLFFLRRYAMVSYDGWQNFNNTVKEMCYVQQLYMKAMITGLKVSNDISLQSLSNTQLWMLLLCHSFNSTISKGRNYQLVYVTSSLNTHVQTHNYNNLTAPKLIYTILVQGYHQYYWSTVFQMNILYLKYVKKHHTCLDLGITTCH